MTEPTSNAVSPTSAWATSTVRIRPSTSIAVSLCRVKAIGALSVSALRRSGPKKADQFRSQDCLYSLTVAPAKGDTSVRVIGAQLDYLLAPEQPAEVLRLLTDPAVRIVTLTITEGGYHVDPGRASSSRPRT